MMGANLALLVLLGQVPASDPVDLVARLGSGRYADREAAGSALEQIGRRALPALRRAHDAKDPEIRSRAAALLSRIEGALLTQPTLVTLDFDDRPLVEVVKSISDQTGIKLVLVPENAPTLADRRVTLREPAPVPFWKAIDRLCESGLLQYALGMHGLPRGRDPVFPLYVNGARPAGPMSDSGPFRVNLVSLHYQRDVLFVTPPPAFANRIGVLPPVPAAGQPTPRPGSTINEQFYAQVQVVAEPRLALSQNGPLRIIRAVDDRGQSLLVPTGGAAAQRYSGYFGLTAGSTVQMQAPLRRPDLPGKSIRVLQGTLPVVVSTRKPDPLVVPMSHAEGKSFHNDLVTLAVYDVRVSPNTNQTSIDLSIRTTVDPSIPLAAQGHDAAVQRPDMHQQQIEVIDAQGRPIPWYHSSFDAEGARITLTLTSHDQGPPAEIRYYALSRASTEVSFEFNDLPLP